MTLSADLPAPNAPAFHTLLREQTFEELRARTTEVVRKQPTNKSERWFLFELLCFGGEWERALLQLQTWATLELEGNARAQLYRRLIQCEMLRGDVFAGRRTPGFVNPAPAWLSALLRANTLMSHGDLPAADDLRATALNEAPTTRGESTQVGSFEWLADSDSRLGPVCEMAVAGGYRWVPFNDMRSLTLGALTTPADMLWRPITVILRDATVLRGYVPARYPDSERSTAAVRLMRETTWTSVGQWGVVAVGQKTLTTESGDFGLFEVGECRFIHEKES